MLSTCNRTEVYAVGRAVPRRRAGRPQLPGRAGLRRRPRTSPTTSTRTTTTPPPPTCSAWPPASTRWCWARARSSARSATPGSGPAPRARPAPGCSALFRHALEVGKRVRSETAIGRGITSVSQAAVAMAADRLGALRAGSGRSCSARARWARAWPSPWPPRARRWPRCGRQPHLGAGGRRWPTQVGGRPVDLDDLPAALAEADLLLTSTGAPAVVVDAADLDAGHGRPGPAGRCWSSTSACPATSTPASATCRGSPCSTWTTCGPSPRPASTERRKEIEPGAGHRRRGGRPLRRGRSPRQAAPLVAALRERGEDLRAAELERFAPAWPGSTPASGRRSRRSPGASSPSCCTSPPCGSRTRPARPGASAWPRPSGSCSTSSGRPGRAGLRAATRAEHRWPGAQTPSTWPTCCAGRRRRRRASSWWWSRPRATAARRPHLGARRPGRVRQGGAGGGARRPGRHRRPLGQGPAVAAAADGLVIAAVPERADPRDALVGRTLADLPAGRPGRHRLGPPAGPAGVAPPRPHLRRPPRQHRDPAGKAAGFDAIVVAAAALRGWAERGAVAEVLDPS